MKDAVDAAIDQCSEVFNLRDSIEEARITAEQSTNDQQRKKYAQRGTRNWLLLDTLALIILDT